MCESPERSKDEQLYEHCTFLLEKLKATFLGGTHGPLGRMDGSWTVADTVKKERMEASAVVFQADILESFTELYGRNRALADKLKKTQAWYAFKVSKEAHGTFFPRKDTEVSITFRVEM